jgi:dTDP-glucose 4,6-dehydratase
LTRRLVTNGLHGKRLPIQGTTGKARDWISVGGQLSSSFAVLEKREKGQVYNIGGNERKNIDIAKEILRHLSLPEAMIKFVGDRPGHDFRYSLSCDKIHRLGWKPQVGFEEGLQKTIDWYKVNKWWWRQLVQ